MSSVSSRRLLAIELELRVVWESLVNGCGWCVKIFSVPRSHLNASSRTADGWNVQRRPLLFSLPYLLHTALPSSAIVTQSIPQCVTHGCTYRVPEVTRKWNTTRIYVRFCLRYFQLWFQMVRAAGRNENETKSSRSLEFQWRIKAAALHF